LWPPAIDRPSLTPQNQKPTTKTSTAAPLATVADTKQSFLKGYPRPIPAMYATVVQELLVQQHFMRYNSRYSYSPIFALGVVSVFDQVLDAFSDDNDRAQVFTAYISALGEDPATYRRDAAALEALAKEAGSPDALSPDAGGNALQQALAQVAEQTSAGKFLYSKFFAIGLFRLLELTGAKEPAALDRLVKAVGVKPDAVSKDLLLYKGVLSKLSAAKEMMRDFVERERRKQAEREAEKAAKSAGGGGGGGGSGSGSAEQTPAAA
jgi:photosystem II biogenesis protein Psp29